jgi:hypothetical protein
MNRVVISKNRILNLENGNVTFKWRDYRDGSKWKIMTVSADEFIRRFLIHILPDGFMRIRYYGLLGNRNKTSKLKLCQKLTNMPVLSKGKAYTLDLVRKVIGRDICKCPACGSDKFQRYEDLARPTWAKTA